MDDTPEVLIPNVTLEQATRLSDLFRGQGGVVTATGDYAGLVENDCFASKYQYDCDTKLLTLEPLRLVRTLTPRRLRKFVQALIAPPPSLAAGDKPTPTPFSCATYNWAIGFFANNTPGVLTFSGVNTTAGNLDSYVPRVNSGDQFSTHADGFWVNKETKDATNGCLGSISYQLADGMTTLTINYYVNTAMPSSASAALSGQNAARYSAVCDPVHQWNGGMATTYLYLYVTLTYLGPG